ncbi:hypothetical protein [Sorangium sp. So ce542]|uniref:hypothetical protein n=1 Tax=Sorangium sp. So ce542 TaxID=3133316 RepID=UPI003F64487D
MGVGYQLVNWSRRERISFAHLPVNTRREICGNPVSASIVAWYLATRQGDEVQFVPDQGEWPFPHGSFEEALTYIDVTDLVIQELIGAQILRDDGIEWADTDEPDAVYIRAIKNIWMDGEP